MANHHPLKPGLSLKENCLIYKTAAQLRDSRWYSELCAVGPGGVLTGWRLFLARAGSPVLQQPCLPGLRVLPVNQRGPLRATEAKKGDGGCLHPLQQVVSAAQII